MVTVIIGVKVTLEAGLSYSDIAKVIAQFKEVESVYLTSGDHDFMVIVNFAEMKQVGEFVSGTLSLVSGVRSVSTHFIMERYKQSGEILGEMQEDDRGLYSV
jgi:DNA-binding Lrp family transcriptional regulator